jgi:RimJ/RimL family protein N-acetyltransferase
MFFLPPEQLVLGGLRLRLRALASGDGAMLHRALHGATHLLALEGWGEPGLTPLRAEQLARAARGRFLLNEQFHFLVQRTDDPDEALGVFSMVPTADGFAEIGGWVAAGSLRQGLGVRVGQAAIRWAFTDWPWPTLTARCAPHNTAGMRLAAAIGLRDARPEADGQIRLQLTRAQWLDDQPQAVGEVIQLKHMLRGWLGQRR